MVLSWPGADGVTFDRSQTITEREACPSPYAQGRSGRADSCFSRVLRIACGVQITDRVLADLKSVLEGATQ